MENMEELIKYKELLDKGIITKEEYEKKKEELLEIKNNESIKQSIKKEKKKLSGGQLIALIFILLIIIGIISATSATQNKITIIDGQAGEYGVYDKETECYYYYLPEGTYKIISYKDTNPAIDLFDAIVWKSDDTSYSLKGKQYRKSVSDENMYTTELSDTFTISKDEYIYIPIDWTITLKIIK